MGCALTGVVMILRPNKGTLGATMRNLILGILVAAIAILGFFSYQSSIQGNSLQADLAASAAAVTALEAEKATLTAEVARLQGLTDSAAAAATEAAAAAETETAALATLTDQIAALEADKIALTDQVAASEAERAALADQLATVTAEAATLTQQTADLQARIDELTAAAAVVPAPVEGAANP